MSPARPPREPPRARRIASQVVRARVTIGLSVLAVLAAVVPAATQLVSTRTAGGILAFLAILIVTGQSLARAYLIQAQAEDLATDRAAADEQRAEERQTKRLEQLLTAMKSLGLIDIKSLDVLRDSRPTTSFYVERHTAAIMDVLGGHWDRTEALRPSQLWMEYRELVGKLRAGETFRSTVILPSDPAILFTDDDFEKYVAAIYNAAARGVCVRRLYILDVTLPPDKEALDTHVREHLRKLHEREGSTATLEARVTSDEAARAHFKIHPDFMVWDNSLLIKSNIPDPGGLVTQADFYFASDNHSKEIEDREKQFDEIFDDPERSLPLTEVI